MPDVDMGNVPMIRRLGERNLARKGSRARPKPGQARHLDSEDVVLTRRLNTTATNRNSHSHRHVAARARFPSLPGVGADGSPHCLDDDRCIGLKPGRRRCACLGPVLTNRFPISVPWRHSGATEFPWRARLQRGGVFTECIGSAHDRVAG